MSSILVIGMTLLATNRKMIKSDGGTAEEVAWIVIRIVNFSISIYWDIVKDWALFPGVRRFPERYDKKHQNIELEA